MSASLEVQRLRIVFAKQAELRYISHLDLMRAWERALMPGPSVSVLTCGRRP